ncbi:MAG: hypothetical protein AAB544_04710 [Patescibacteria group bacterium]
MISSLLSTLLTVLVPMTFAYVTPDEVFDLPPEAQSSQSPMTPEEESEKAEIQQRIFYRNGETKTVSDQTASEAPVVSEPVVSEPVSEPIVSDPVVIEETMSSSASGEQHTAPVMAETTEESAAEAPRGISTSMIASGTIAVVIVIGGLLFLLRMFLRRFKPTISKEAIAPPPVASTTEPSLPHLEAALGVKKDEPPSA